MVGDARHSWQVDDIDKILLRWGIKKATFVGHSYGSVILSWMIQQVSSLPSPKGGFAR